MQKNNMLESDNYAAPHCIGGGRMGAFAYKL